MDQNDLIKKKLKIDLDNFKKYLFQLCKTLNQIEFNETIETINATEEINLKFLINEINKNLIKHEYNINEQTNNLELFKTIDIILIRDINIKNYILKIYEDYKEETTLTEKLIKKIIICLKILLKSSNEAIKSMEEYKIITKEDYLEDLAVENMTLEDFTDIIKKNDNLNIDDYFNKTVEKINEINNNDVEMAANKISKLFPENSPLIESIPKLLNETARVLKSTMNQQENEEKIGESNNQQKIGNAINYFIKNGVPELLATYQTEFKNKNIGSEPKNIFGENSKMTKMFDNALNNPELLKLAKQTENDENNNNNDEEGGENNEIPQMNMMDYMPMVMNLLKTCKETDT